MQSCFKPSYKDRRRNNKIDRLKTVLFGLMDTGYASLRNPEERCKLILRYMYQINYAQPGYRNDMPKQFP